VEHKNKHQRFLRFPFLVGLTVGKNKAKQAAATLGIG